MDETENDSKARSVIHVLWCMFCDSYFVIYALIEWRAMTTAVYMRSFKTRSMVMTELSYGDYMILLMSKKFSLPGQKGSFAWISRSVRSHQGD